MFSPTHQSINKVKLAVRESDALLSMIKTKTLFTRLGQLGEYSMDLQARKETDFPNDALCFGLLHFSLKEEAVSLFLCFNKLNG